MNVIVCNVCSYSPMRECMRECMASQSLNFTPPQKKTEQKKQTLINFMILKLEEFACWPGMLRGLLPKDTSQRSHNTRTVSSTTSCRSSPLKSEYHLSSCPNSNRLTAKFWAGLHWISSQANVSGLFWKSRQQRESFRIVKTKNCFFFIWRYIPGTGFEPPQDSMFGLWSADRRTPEEQKRDHGLTKPWFIRRVETISRIIFN